MNVSSILLWREKALSRVEDISLRFIRTCSLKRLMGRYGTRENEIDHLLRTETFVDLYSIVRQSLIAGIEKYSIKDLEQFYEFKRKPSWRSSFL